MGCKPFALVPPITCLTTSLTKKQCSPNFLRTITPYLIIVAVAGYTLYLIIVAVAGYIHTISNNSSSGWLNTTSQTLHRSHATICFQEAQLQLIGHTFCAPNTIVYIECNKMNRNICAHILYVHVHACIHTYVGTYVPHTDLLVFVLTHSALLQLQGPH